MGVPKPTISTHRYAMEAEGNRPISRSFPLIQFWHKTRSVRLPMWMWRCHSSTEGGIVLCRIAYLAMVVALVGCGTRSNMGGREAGTSPDTVAMPDGRARDDGTASSDAVAPTDPPADALPDLLAQPEASADLIFQDARPEIGAPDRTGPDITLPSDTADDRLPDVPAEAPPADGQPDLSADRAADVARESQPPVVDGGLASYCTGSLARMVLNGTEAHPAVHGKNLPLSCCFANQLEVISATVGFPLTVMWHTMADGISATPLTLDLASLPQGWTVRVVAGCDPLLSTCSTPGDIYDSGLEGSLQVTRLASGFDTTVCLHLVEPAGSSHPLIHTMDLYAPHVLATY
jgi:hypothetical protein